MCASQELNLELRPAQPCMAVGSPGPATLLAAFAGQFGLLVIWHHLTASVPASTTTSTTFRVATDCPVVVASDHPALGLQAGLCIGCLAGIGLAVLIFLGAGGLVGCGTSVLAWLGLQGLTKLGVLSSVQKHTEKDGLGGGESSMCSELERSPVGEDDW